MPLGAQRCSLQKPLRPYNGPMGSTPIQNVPLAQHTTLALGGPAQFFATATNLQQLQELCKWAKQQGLPVLPLGGGSNLVVADKGVSGLVLQVGLQGFSVQRDGDCILLEVAAGETLDQVVELAVDEGWAGLECLSGIPGTVGATPVQNVGAYGQEIAHQILWVEVFHCSRLRLCRLTPQACAFSYRESRFRRSQNPWIITRVAFRLTPGGAPTISYPELKLLLGKSSSPPSLGLVRQAVLELRRSKGMVLVEGQPTGRSVGSFFKNPVLPQEAFTGLLARIWGQGILPHPELPPHYPMATQVKVPAAWLVEKAGFPRGLRWGKVGISPLHALSLLHYGGGSTHELLALASAIQVKVEQTFQVLLEPEPVFWGFAGTSPLGRALAV